MTNDSTLQSGFRLKRLELYNWGTFDGHIWSMTPEGDTAVLTGANGSGKSTVVDALLTLLVDSRQRNYNLASGAGSVRERNERTYVRGQYSRSRGESAIEARAKTLRDQNAHSVLLGVFYDAAQTATVTLVQVFWIGSSDRVEKRFYVASCELSIETHFPQRLVTPKDLPAEVQSFNNVFKTYITAARKALGLGGRPKALDLFNETVAVKDIASLNTFVRDHMLDKGDPELRVEALRNQYRELNEAHAAIQRANNQVNILQPLVESAKEYRHYAEQIIQNETAISVVPFYVAERASSLLHEALDKNEHVLQAEHSKLQTADSELRDRRQALEDVRLSIGQNSIGQMKREIESKVTVIKREITSLKRAAERYDEEARLVGLPVYSNEDAFYQNLQQVNQLHSDAAIQVTTLDRQRLTLQTELIQFRTKWQELQKEILYLKQNPSNIPAQVARIRHTLHAALNIPLDVMPFVGELLEVRPDQTRWEGAIERLMHSFAQDLIIDETYYAQVSSYINQHHLGGRLVYRRVDPNQRTQYLPEPTVQRGAMAYDKVQIAEHTPYQDWLSAMLIQRFAYVCCDSLADFQQAEKAMTAQGQIKHSVSRHEKDDRRNLDDRRNYVLGWDNRQKLRQLETEQDTVRREGDKAQEQVAQAEAQLERERRYIRALENVLAVKAFHEIDWHTSQLEYDDLQRRLAELTQQSAQLQILENQRDQLESQVAEIELRRDLINKQIGSRSDTSAKYQRQIDTYQRQLASVPPAIKQDWQAMIAVIQLIDKHSLTIDTLSTRSQELEVFLNRGIATFKGVQNRSEAIMLNAMNMFRREYADEGAAITATIESLPTFERIYHQLENDDLPKYQERFKQMLDRTVTRAVQVFFTNLSEQERAIDRSIAELNESLAQVDYGAGSIIRLIAERSKDQEINDFQRQLKACIPDVGDRSYEELERSYNQIKALITRFDDDPGWMRRVIDVRRWRVFAAEQLDSQGQQIDYYSDSSGKSGGQKAKLAYTILASAIAYQYGLQDSSPQERTFRFVVIDEAFSKLDDDNARYAMKLFEQLGLQLLVVTPMQQLHVIESYVQAYHVVVNNPEGSYSRVFNLTQLQYQQRRREFQAEN